MLKSKGRAEPVLSLTIPVTAAYPSLDSAAGKLECPPIRKPTPALRSHPTLNHRNGKADLDVMGLEKLTLLLTSMCGLNGPDQPAQLPSRHILELGLSHPNKLPYLWSAGVYQGTGPIEQQWQGLHDSRKQQAS